MKNRDLAEIACPSLKALWDQETARIGPAHTPETAFVAGYKAHASQVLKIIVEQPTTPEIFEGTNAALDRISLTKRQAD